MNGNQKSQRYPNESTIGPRDLRLFLNHRRPARRHSYVRFAYRNADRASRERARTIAADRPVADEPNQ
jgi:hypothetical protein